ncbi:TIGR04283 family arsenosugar biosynthesis glycosyltransferase [Coralliovum pocilloporae]|uniref:TIGR04283 family arsenosugar biosynthesis glycosyltransferase n=1 Tax=Coralliovum pocilloporae TaxID=3066369 RepID=UPI003306F90D
MSISVVIPVLNEEKALPRLLASLKALDHLGEIIVVDGGSSDRTQDCARDHDARVLVSPCGRGQQLRAGADIASGDVLWFLHADTEIQPGCDKAILDALADPDVPGGNFRLLFDGGSDFAEWLTGFYADLRPRGFYYGDSGIFVRRSVYRALGGIRDMALMEDYDFVCRLEKTGPTANISRPALITSSRRFQQRKKWRIVFQWIWLHMLYYLRFSPDYLAALYRSSDHIPADTPLKKRG